jgi:hypothetical protein
LSLQFCTGFFLTLNTHCECPVPAHAFRRRKFFLKLLIFTQGLLLHRAPSRRQRIRSRRQSHSWSCRRSSRTKLVTFSKLILKLDHSWPPSSSILRHSGHLVSTSMPLLFRFIRNGRLFVVSLHRK